MGPVLRLCRAAPSAVGIVAVAIVVLGSGSQGAGASGATDGGTSSHASQGSSASSQTVVEVAGNAVGSEPVPAHFPSAATTGVPVGTRLLVHSGNVEITTNGAVISDQLIEGCLTVHANHVTIRDTKIVCHQNTVALTTFGSQTGTVITNVEIDGGGIAKVGLDLKNAVATAVNVHGTNDGVHLGNRAILQDSYVHDLGVEPGFHHDDLQTLQASTANGIKVLHNTLQAYGPQRSDNSAYHMGSGSISNVLIDGNFIDGGHYSIQVADAANQHSIVVSDNHFGRHYHYGILMLGNTHGTAVSFVRNVWETTGRAATPANSKGYGTAE